MKTFLSLLLLLNTANAFAAFPKPPEVRYELNNSPYGERVQLGTQIIDKTVHVLKAVWDNSVVGSTTGSISLLDRDGKAAKLPVGAVVIDCTIEVKTGITLDTSVTRIAPYFALSTGVDGVKDLKANVPAASLATAGLVACIPVGSAATSIRITTESTPILTITSATHSPPYSTTTPSVATAGKLNVLIQYILSE